MNLHVNESEKEALENIEEVIDTAWNMVDNMKRNCGSIIEGHDILEEI